MKQPETQPKTIVINNFIGALTRSLTGDLNSGLAKFYSSWGYNPFAKPGNLTWNAQPQDYIDPINGLVVDGKVRFENGVQYVYAITNTGHFIKINYNGTVTDLHTLTTGSPTFDFGGSLYFYNGHVWITNDKGLSRIDFDGTNETQVGTWDSSHFIQDTYHPLVEFQGKLLVGNTTDGTTTNFGTVDTTNLIVNYNTLSPALPTGIYIHDMDITSDFSYLTISGSSIPQEDFTPGNDIGNSYAGDSFVFRWNGSDVGITSGISLPNFGITALNNFGQAEYSFMYDSIGVGLYDGGQKIITLQDNKSPLPNATASTGNIITWMAPEVERQLDPTGRTSLNSIYFYGQLDEQSPKGLWRMLRQQSDLTNGSVNEVPFMAFVTNQYVVVESDGSLTQQFPIQFYSRQEFTTGTPTNEFFAFTYGVGVDLGLSVVSGVYETQTQLFPKRIGVGQIRVYCEPTVTGNSFQFEVIGVDGIPLDNGTTTYTFGDILDPQTNAPEVTRINLNLDTATTFGFAIRITNLGTVNMTITKIEVDYDLKGK